MFRVLLVTSVVMAAQAHALWVDESFESGDLDAGGWSSAAVTGVTVTVDPAAAHRGQFGLRTVDSETTLESTPGATVAVSLPDLPSALYSRFWVRIPSRQGDQAFEFMSLFASGTTAQGTVETVDVSSTGDLVLIAQPLDLTGAVGYAAQSSTVVMSDGGWHLLEIAAFGLGSDAGLLVSYADGAEAARISGIPAWEHSAAQLLLGETWASTYVAQNFTGIIDMDDVRVDVSPLASRLVLTARASVLAGQCAPLSVALAATAALEDGGAVSNVPAPYAVSFEVAGVPVYSDAQCNQALTTPVLASQSAGTTVYARFSDAGALTVTVAQVPPADFLPSTLALSVSAADGGVDAGGTLAPDGGVPTVEESYYAMHCGVASNSPCAVTLLVALWWVRRRAVWAN